MQQSAQTDLANLTWFEEHFNELVEKYPGQWVAIRHEKLVGASSALKDLVADVKASQQPIENTCFKFVPDTASVSGLSDLYGVWQGMDVTDAEIEASKLKIESVQI